MRRLLDLGLVLILALLAIVIWLGQQRPADSYLEVVRKSGVLRVGMDPTYPPFDTLSEGKVSGSDAYLAAAIATDLGVHVEFQALALDTLYDALEAGKVDMLISALPVIPERMDKVRYSSPYYQAGQVLLIRAVDSRITSLQSLEARAVGVEKGSTADTEARRLVREVPIGMDVRPLYSSAEDALSALAKGEVDAAITDGLSAQTYLHAHPGTLTVLSPPVTDEPYVVAVPAKASALAAAVDNTISRLNASGELGRIMGER